MINARGLWLVGVALMSIGPSVGQNKAWVGRVEVVDRMCLWNADKATWARVGLSRAQIRKMEEIRSRYPAVVDGQWILGDADGLANDPSAEATATTDPAAPMGDTTGVTQGLQAEVRAVLTPRQVNEWMALCNGRYRR